MSKNTKSATPPDKRHNAITYISITLLIILSDVVSACQKSRHWLRTANIDSTFSSPHVAQATMFMRPRLLEYAKHVEIPLRARKDLSAERVKIPLLSI